MERGSGQSCRFKNKIGEFFVKKWENPASTIEHKFQRSSYYICDGFTVERAFTFRNRNPFDLTTKVTIRNGVSTFSIKGVVRPGEEKEENVGIDDDH